MHNQVLPNSNTNNSINCKYTCMCVESPKSKESRKEILIKASKSELPKKITLLNTNLIKLALKKKLYKNGQIRLHFDYNSP